ncbi:MAG: hypothetical protein LBM27_04395 [Lactobacillaceae bacterium]|jgi:hypothetical protein|nr:hypothetical protein [Lactobacillaceae bacterium]
MDNPSNFYIEKLKVYRDIFKEFSEIKTRINSAIAADTQISQRQIPGELSTPLSIDEKNLLKIANGFADDEPEKLGYLFELDTMLSSFRDYLISQYGMFGYVSQSYAKNLADYIQTQNVIEIMAGNGYLSAGIYAYAKDINILATDNFNWENQGVNPNPVFPVENKEAIRTLEQNLKIEIPATVIMSWAPDTTTADLLVLEYLRHSGFFSTQGNQFIVIGEKNGATNSRQFWKKANLSEIREVSNHIQHFDLIDDRAYSVK